jgi:hypothetical protein
MSTSRWAWLAVAVALHAPVAHADKAAADVAFAEARKLMAAGKAKEACPKFEYSFAQDPQVGVLLNLADCHEQIGKLATAWAEFRAAIELARNHKDDREAFATERAGKLAPRISYVLIHKPADAAGLSVRLDDRDVTALVEVEIPIDPGSHTIRSSSTGHAEASSTITITKEGTHHEADAPVGKDAAADDKHPAVAPPQGHGGRHAIAWISTIAGVGAAGVGLYFGRTALQKWDQSHKFCDDMNNCDAQGRVLVDDAKQAALKADVLVGVGGGLILVGAIVWLTTPSEAAPTPSAVAVRPVVSPSFVGGYVGVSF